MRCAAIIAALVGIVGCNIHVRNTTIENCRERGGQAITAPWYSGALYWDVRCLEGGN